MPLPRLTLRHTTVPAEHFFADREKFNLAPSYQRGSVWTPTQRVNLMRSMFMGLPIGAVVLAFHGYEVGPAFYTVIDGKQRIETLRAFVDDGFAVPVAWFDDSKGALRADEPVSGSPDADRLVRYSGMPRYYQSLVNDFGLSVLTTSLKTVEDEAELFLLINAGGTSQSAEGLNRAAHIANGLPLQD